MSEKKIKIPENKFKTFDKLSKLQKLLQKESALKQICK
jgi:hypothetical protein